MKPPSISKTAFDCPYCGAFTSQEWLGTWAKSLGKDFPAIPDADFIRRVLDSNKVTEEEKEVHVKWAKEIMSPEPCVRELEGGERCYLALANVNLSRCFVCSRIAVWVADRLVSPKIAAGPNPNPDLPAGIRATFEEARRIFNESPRGAATLLRLCVQELCIYLGGKGEILDADIKMFVANGLNPLVQQSLNIVRVIGNEAVHPGTIDLNDNSDTALTLFGLVNSIVEQMISHPKHVTTLYGALPEAKRKAIEKRDAKNRAE